MASENPLSGTERIRASCSSSASWSALARSAATADVASRDRPARVGAYKEVGGPDRLSMIGKEGAPNRRLGLEAADRSHTLGPQALISDP